MSARNDYADFVASLTKSGETILDELTPHDASMLHLALGVCGEAGELADAIKKAAIYRKPIDLENILEELGDIEFYLEAIRQAYSMSRADILHYNRAKLSKRYAKGYSNKQAQDRADKQGN